MNSITQFLVRAVPLVMLVGCGSNFQYVKKPTTNPVVKANHEVRSIQGLGSAEIMWVVDTSGSMGPYTNKVIRNTDLFMNTFTGLARFTWRMGMISTDISDLTFLGLTTPFTNQSPNPIPTFQQAVTDAQLGMQGGSEKTFDPVMQTLNAFPAWSDANAAFILIIISDEDEQSTQYNAQTFYQELLRRKNGRAELIRSYLVLKTTKQTCTDSETEANPSPYTQFAALNASKVYSIDCPNYGSILANLATDITTSVTRPRLFLGTRRPQLPTLQVTYKGTELKGGPEAQQGFWIYDFRSNSIFFHDLTFAVDPKSDVVNVTFRAEGE